jgi:LCP family protein required for cell wall assembly
VRRLAAWVALGGLVAWLAVGAALANPPVRAQTETPTGTIQLRRVQHAGFVPAKKADDPIFVLAIGSDARPGVCMPVERCLADSLHLIGINPRKHAATILGFPRDSYVPIPGFGTEKINNALFHGGPELVVETIEELTGITIDYYMLTSFSQVVAMVDLIGGLEVDVPYPMNDSSSGAVLDAGLQELTGKETLAFSRNRKDTPNGDFSRSENQGRVLVGALDQFQAQFSRDPSTLFRWIAVGSTHLQTDLTLEEVFELMLTAATINPDKVTNLVAPGGIGMAGEASIVVLSAGADEIYADMRRDGLA